MCVLAASAVADTNALAITYIDKPPYYFTTNNQVDGFLARHVQEVFVRAGVQATFIATPANRALLRIQQNVEPECSIGWFRNAEREQAGRFSNAIYRDPPMHVVMHYTIGQRVQKAGTLKALLADPTLSLGLIQGYSYGTVIDDMLAHSAAMQERLAITPVQNLLRIAYHRVDFTVVDQVEFAYLKATLTNEHRKLIEDNLRSQRLSDMPVGNQRYLYCTDKTPQTLLDRFNRALADTPLEVPYPHSNAPTPDEE